MPVAANRYYNDPALGQAFANLADAFAPPSGTDASGYATAAAKKAEASRLAEMFAYSKDPNYDQTRADRMGTLSGLYTPTQSFYAVNTADATARRGQDVDAATSITNNQNTVRGSTIGQLYDNIGQGEISPAVPESVMSTIGMPGIEAQVGQAKPLSETELKAAILGRQPEALQNAAVLSGTPVEKVGPEGRYVYRSDAVGQTATPTASPATTLNNYRTPDGKVGTYAVIGGKAVDSQTGLEVPPGSIDFSASLQGGGAETNLAPTASNITAGNNLNASLDGATFTVQQMKEILARNKNAGGIPGRIKGFVQSLTSSAQQVISTYADEAPDAAIQLDEARKLLDSTLGGGTGYDKDVVRLTSGLFDLAYARAQIANPTGEVSRQAFERSLESFGQSLFGSQMDVEVGLDAFLTDTIAAGRVRAKSLLQQNNGAAPAAPDAAPAVAEEWLRAPDGTLVKAGGQ